MSITPIPELGQYPWREQYRQWALDTQAAAENAKVAADQVHADVAGAVADAQAAQVAATNAAGLVGAPAGEAVNAAIKPGGAARYTLELETAVTSRLLNGLKLVNPNGLSRYSDAVASAHNEVVPVQWVGHSIVYGIGSDNLNGGMSSPDNLYRQNACPVITRKLFARDYGHTPSEGFIGFYPAQGYAVLSDPPPAHSASIGPLGNYSPNGLTFGGYNLWSAGAGRSITIPATNSGRFTHLDVFWWGSDSGAYTPSKPRVTIDGVVKEAGGTVAEAGNLNVIKITGLSDTAHTVVIDHNGTGGLASYVFGMVAHHGKGVLVNRLGAPGAKAYDLTGATLTGQARQRNIDALLLPGYAKLAIIQITANDAYTNTPVTTWTNQVQELIDTAVSGGACVLLLADPPIHNGEALSPKQSDYDNALKALAETQEHVAYASLTELFGERSAAVATGMYPPLNPSTVHPGTLGHALIGQSVHRALPLSKI